jgi:hypothetical protein
MGISVPLIGILAMLGTALACYVLLRKGVYNLLDPIILACISIVLSAALLAALCDAEQITWDKFQLFCLVLTAYLIGCRIAASFFNREKFRALLSHAVQGLGRTDINVILMLAAAATLVLAVLGYMEGATGDARQGFARAFRPLVVLQGGLFLFALVTLLSHKLSTLKVAFWIVLLIALSIPFSGRSIFVPILIWFGIKLFLERKQVTWRVTLTLFGTVLLGAGLMVAFAYGRAGFLNIVYLIAGRLWMSGDVYLFAYAQDALNWLRGSYDVEYVAYMLHPLTSLVGIRAYDRPLGAMLTSQLQGVDLYTGPNPHMPVVLDYFFPGMFGVSFLIALLIGFLVMSTRSAGIALAGSRSRYLRLGGITMAIFSPASGFVDTSQVLIGAIGIAAVTLVGMTIELLLPTRRQLLDHGAATGAKATAIAQ